MKATHLVPQVKSLGFAISDDAVAKEHVSPM
jgi:hypothetical protein